MHIVTTVQAVYWNNIVLRGITCTDTPGTNSPLSDHSYYYSDSPLANVSLEKGHVLLCDGLLPVLRVIVRICGLRSCTMLYRRTLTHLLWL